ncbi:hypothetical protein [Pseudoalteromonas luteoviolacea]|uniref:hypothetical protein n=1 Tax=Pseudoalteromonas luteoviolacea TaxID=43657 RepID=UPI0011508367|nr:hypothetical protein [Pseudoalteromonas luteoviolacea]TQF71123.1 hypothetical protein FLM44_08550 [Pseudoalteromonas luteoviolacea]
MDESLLLGFIEKIPPQYTVVIIVAFIPLIIKSANSVINFYEDVRVRRVLNRIKYLSDNIANDSEVSSYLESLKCNEVFRVATGIETYPDRAKMLMRIFDLGIADNKELKGIYSYLTPLDSKVKASLSNIDRFRIVHSFVFGVILMFIGIVIAIFLQFEGPAESIIGSLTMLFFVFFGAYVFRDFRQYQTLKRVTKALIKLEQYAESESDIKLFNFRLK